jgi:opacity protein-like surface antigen
MHGPASRRAVQALGLALGLGLARMANASPLEFIAVRDPFMAELRVLECYDLPADSGRYRLPHFNTWPLQRLELMGDGPPPLQGTLVRSLVAERLERELQRDAMGAFATYQARLSTPRVFQRAWPGDDRAELSLGLEGAFDMSRLDGDIDTQWRDGSGVHVRAGAQVDRWLAFMHLALGKLENASSFTDVLVQNTDIAAQTDEAYLSYSAGTHWSATMGRQRFAWGPGEQGSLLLSRTAAPFTALYLHLRINALRADGFSINATSDPGRGEQFAAHRIEWQPSSGLRLGVAEAARYLANGWEAVYVASVIPYSLAQRILQQEGDSTGARNNIELSFDASWRPADGTRLYAEVLFDDLHAKSAATPNKYGWQVGADGAWTHGFTRLTWNTEYTWLSRYTYTSFFGREFTAQGLPIGFPTGPDSRRLRVRTSWDPRVAWQLTGVVSRTWKGENDFDEPFIPGSPVPDVGQLEGIVQTTDEASGVLRWWPASGVDLAVSLGFQRLQNANHVSGDEQTGLTGSIAFRLVR